LEGRSQDPATQFPVKFLQKHPCGWIPETTLKGIDGRIFQLFPEFPVSKLKKNEFGVSFVGDYSAFTQTIS
jgi:hypothetical protein